MPGSPVKRARRNAAASGGDIAAAGEEAKRKHAGKLSGITEAARRVVQAGEALRSQLPVPVPMDGDFTERERKYIEYAALGMSPAQAARHAGYPHPKSDAVKIHARPHVQQAISEQRAKYEEAGRVTKRDVIDGFREAIEQAKMLTDPIAQIAGWREIAKLCGHYEPQKKELAISVQGDIVVQKIQQLSDADLLRLAEGEVFEGEVLRTED